ncbi:MAG: alpha/beta hydrolase [Aureliella sp.]
MEDIEHFAAGTRKIELADGRSLGFLEVGDPSGRPVFFFHGLPGSCLEAIAMHDVANKHGYHIIAPDRPGFGKSAAQPGRRLLDWPKDVVQLADAIGIATFGVIGMSGGGPFGLACAYAIPQRLEFVIDIAGAAPLYSDAVARRELSFIDQLFATLGVYLPVACLRLPFAYLAYRLRKMKDGHEFIKLMGNAFSEPDKKTMLESGNARLLIRDCQEAFRQGTSSVALESKLIYQSWGFSLGDIDMPVHIFHGTEDLLVPFSFGEYKAQQIPRSIFEPLPNKGHFHILFNMHELMGSSDVFESNTRPEK